MYKNILAVKTNIAANALPERSCLAMTCRLFVFLYCCCGTDGEITLYTSYDCTHMKIIHVKKLENLLKIDGFCANHHKNSEIIRAALDR